MAWGYTGSVAWGYSLCGMGYSLWQLTAREAVVEHHVDGHDRAVVEVVGVVEGAAGAPLVQLYASSLEAAQQLQLL